MKDREIDAFRYDNPHEGPLHTGNQQSMLLMDENDLRSVWATNALPQQPQRPGVPQLLRGVAPVAPLGLGNIFNDQKDR